MTNTSPISCYGIHYFIALCCISLQTSWSALFFHIQKIFYTVGLPSCCFLYFFQFNYIFVKWRDKSFTGFKLRSYSCLIYNIILMLSVGLFSTFSSNSKYPLWVFGCVWVQNWFWIQQFTRLQDSWMTVVDLQPILGYVWWGWFCLCAVVLYLPLLTLFVFHFSAWSFGIIRFLCSF